jgi:uncharacterized protein involved in tellurium resistance
LEEYTASIFMVKEYAKQTVLSAHCLLLAGFLLGLFFDLEDGGKMFLQALSNIHGTPNQNTVLFMIQSPII